MANQKGVAMQQTIVTLRECGQSIRSIARDLGIARNTVRGYVREHVETDPPGSKVVTGSLPQIDPPAEKVVTGSTRSQSLCLEYQEQIEAKLAAGLCGQRIFQDLVSEHGFGGSYSSVQRFCKKLRGTSPLPFRRMEVAPGEEAQIDFGCGAWVVDGSGKRRRPWLFRIVLSHSRKGYSEVVYRQSTELFIRALENAFIHFGGVPKKLVVDNLKAAVARADWYDPELQPKIRSFCRHYGTVMLPTKPRMPRHKGKVERAIDYAQENALKGRVFRSLAEQNEYLKEWEQNVADTRIHGTTRRQVRAAFEEEKLTLIDLNPMLFPSFEEAYRKCHMDGHIEVQRAYYSVPVEFARQHVLVRWDSRMVRIFHPATGELVRVHARAEAGTFSTHEGDIDQRKISGIERGEHYLLKKIDLAGPDIHKWSEQMLKVRGLPGVRVLQGVLNLTGRYELAAINHGARQAIALEAYRLKELKALIEVVPKVEQPQLALAQEHSLIRPLSAYSAQLTQKKGQA